MSRQVRAAVCFAANEPMRIMEVTLADPGPGQVLVRFLATGLCHSDQHVLDGSHVQEMPVILGHEGLGEVVEVGEGVTGFAAGDRVIPYLVPDCGQCALCQSGRTNMCVQFQARRMAPTTPFSLDGVPVQQYCGIASFAEMSVVHADMLTKVSVAVFGAGGVGLSVIQGARLAGASTIIAIDRNDMKRDVAIELGATHFINPDQVEDIVAEVWRITGMGADFGFECVGIPALALKALEATNPAWGVGVCVGVMPTGSQLSTPPLNLMMGRHWTGSFMGGAKRQDVARFVDMFVAGDYSLEQIVSHRLTLDEINHGFDMMKSGEAVRSVVEF